MIAPYSSGTMIPDAFGITVDDDAAMALYDMHLDEAARKIMVMMTDNRNEGGLESHVRTHTTNAAFASNRGRCASKRGNVG